MPGTVQSLVLARVAGLTPPARDLVRLAAVAGVQVSHGLLATASGLDDEVLLTAARELAEQAPSGGRSLRGGVRLSPRADPGGGVRRSAPGRTTEAPSGGGPDAHRRPGPRAGGVGGRWLRRWPSTGSPPVSSNERCPPRSRPATRPERCWPSPERSVTTSGPWSCGIEWPILRCWSASDVPSCSIERPRWPAGRATRSVPSVTSTPPSTSWSSTAAAPAQLALLYAQKCPYLWWNGRDAEMLEWTAYALARVPSEPLTPGRVGILAYHAHGLCLRSSGTRKRPRPRRWRSRRRAEPAPASRRPSPAVPSPSA